MIPTRHSLKGPPPVCKDPIELQELTQQLLETPVGSLFCQNLKTTSTYEIDVAQDRDEAYALAHDSTQTMEYLLRGYNHRFAGSLCNVKGDSSLVNAEEASSTIATMLGLMQRLEQEGEMYLKLRGETIGFQASRALSDTVSSLNSKDSTTGIFDDSSSSSSSSSDDEKDDLEIFEDDRDEEIEIGSSTFGEVGDLFSSVVQHKHEHEHELEELATVGKDLAGDHAELLLLDFANPGVTTAMYDAILDSMACATEMGGSQLEPENLYDVVLDALNAHALNNQSSTADWFPYTVPTMATYNAALRGIGNLCLPGESIDATSKQQLVDQGLGFGFSVYNHLSNNDHGLPKRNAASIIYLLRVIKACLPPSRTRGNITVTLWHQASMEGLVTPELIAAIQDLHVESNGSEFDVFLDAISKCQTSRPSKDSEKVVIMPQRFARFAKKYQHSHAY
jgi:hypothetical protein